MTPQQVLLAAARLIEEGGWIQPVTGGYSEGMGQCAFSAIFTIGNGAFDTYNGAARRLLAFLTGDPDGSYGRIFEWNDAPGRTKAEVLAALHGAAGAT